MHTPSPPVLLKSFSPGGVSGGYDERQSAEPPTQFSIYVMFQHRDKKLVSDHLKNMFIGYQTQPAFLAPSSCQHYLRLSRNSR
ncbi:hypothetical protein BaRGS_00038792, partial [Batillaria attramentaria]